MTTRIGALVATTLALWACVPSAFAGTTIAFEAGPTARSEGAPEDLDFSIVGAPGTGSPDAWRVTIVPSGGTPPYEFALEPAPPAGMVFDAAHGTLEGGALPSGISEFVVAVRDADGSVAASDLSVVSREDGAPTASSSGFSP